MRAGREDREEVKLQKGRWMLRDTRRRQKWSALSPSAPGVRLEPAQASAGRKVPCCLDNTHASSNTESRLCSCVAVGHLSTSSSGISQRCGPKLVMCHDHGCTARTHQQLHTATHRLSLLSCGAAAGSGNGTWLPHMMPALLQVVGIHDYGMAVHAECGLWHDTVACTTAG